MGASGSGKTTLLNLLSSRSVKGSSLYYEGDLLLNRYKVKNLSKFKNLIGFVPQENTVVKTATVKENFEIYGKYRRVKNMDERVNSLIKSLDLEKCQETIVGNAFSKGISGGELKRTSIGIELMSDPEVLFLDEPTTGLDAKTALDIVLHLRKICKERAMGIISVIHQPRAEILEQFDQILVLSEGNLIYDGTLEGIGEKLESLGYELPEFETPVDFLMKLIDQHQVMTNLVKDFDLPEYEIQLLRDIVLNNRVNRLTHAEEVHLFEKRSTILDQFEKRMSIQSKGFQGKDNISNDGSLLTILLNTSNKNLNRSEDQIPKDMFTKLSTSKYQKLNHFMQFYILFSYNIKFFCRNKFHLFTMFMQQVVTLIMIWLIFRNLGSPEDDTIVAIQNRQGFNALMSMYGFFTGFWSDVIVFVQKRKLFCRDQQGGYYDESSYYLANQLYAMPFYSVLIFLVSTFFFFCFPLNFYPNSISNWLYFYFFVYVGGFVSGAALGSIVATLSDRVQEITAIMAFITPPLTIASGLYNNIQTSTIFIQLFSYLSPSKFTYQGLLLNEFQNFQDYLDSCMSYYPCDDDPSKKCRKKVPEEFRASCNPFSINSFVQHTMFENLCFIVGLCVFYQLIGFLIFKYRNRQKFIKYRKL